MYRILVPLGVFYPGRSLDRERALAELKRTQTARVILVAPEILDTEKIDKGMPELADCIAFFEKNGLKTGVWIGQTIGHGGWRRSGKPFPNIININGIAEGSTCCPLDEGFIQTVCDGVEKIAKAGAKWILVDDDFRMGWRSGTVGCFCPRHIGEFCKIMGKQMSREEIAKKVFTGPPSRYRDEWLRLTGNSLIRLAAAMREAADRVDPNIRMGLCACCSTWDIDGVDSYTITRIFAGKNRPFLRLIGAPYWTRGMRKRLAYIIELERLELSWTDEDIEIFSEGDTYPRPRYQTPASYLEGFDTALRADGRFYGILKYMFDYTADFRYETKYADLTERNRELYAGIDELFSGLSSVGVNVVRAMRNLSGADLPETVDSSFITNYFFYPSSLQFLTDNSIPVTYNNPDFPSIIFGQDARSAGSEYLKNGVILDAPAARILQEAGIDTGIDSMTEAPGAFLEYYIDEDQYVSVSGRLYYDIKTKDGAKILSSLHTDNGIITGAYLYENRSGMRFLVYAFDGYACRDAAGVFRCYCRQRQLGRALDWLANRRFVAFCPGHPDLYMQVKKSESGMAIGLWNFFDDAVENLVIELGKAYTKAEILNASCSYTLENSRLVLHGTIPPYGFVGVGLQ